MIGNCRALIEELIGQAGEARAVDYKRGMAFPRRSTEEDAWASLMKDLLAFGNSRDGGYLVIGVDNDTKKPDGMSAEQAASWDITVIGDALESVSGPPPQVMPCQAELPEGRVVALRIAEFAELPHVCTAGITSSRSKRTLLRQGALYIRTAAGTSQEIDSEALMREFLSRAYVRSSEATLRQIKALIDAHWPGERVPEEELYSDQIKQDFDEMGWP